MILNRVRGGGRALLTVLQPSLQPNAGIKGKSAQVKAALPERPPPFPYQTKRYNVFRGFIDKTSWRFNENSKIIVIEGNIASGKTAFAKALAEELDMKYLHAANLDDLYVNSYGYDLRQLDDQLPESVKSFDEKKFLLNPKHENTALFQINMFRLKYMQYVDAICHLMNTGQGLVIERSCFSDQVFVEAMYTAGYISKGGRSVYNALRRHTIPQVLKPHLVIYLDVPVPRVMENIKKRAIQHEVKSQVLSQKYLSDIEKFYKELHLPDISVHSELLVYDWSNGGDVEVVVEDIERIDFDRFEQHDKKLYDWRFHKEWDLCEERIMYTMKRDTFERYFNVPRSDVPELMASGDDRLAFLEAFESAPGNKWAEGFNEDMGDKPSLFHLGSYSRRRSPWL